MQKTPSAERGVVGDKVTFTIVVNNTGPSTITGIEVVDDCAHRPGLRST